jgi:hypothetical protein
MRKPINYFEAYRDPAQSPDITKKQTPNIIAAELEYQQSLGIINADVIKIEVQKSKKTEATVWSGDCIGEARTDVNPFIKQMLGFRDSVQTSKLQKLVLPAFVALGVGLGNLSQEPSKANDANVAGPKLVTVDRASVDVLSPKAQRIKDKLGMRDISNSDYLEIMKNIDGDLENFNDARIAKKDLGPALKGGTFNRGVAIKKLGLKYLIKMDNSTSKIPNIKPANQEKPTVITAPISKEKIAGLQLPPAIISSKAPKPAITSKPAESPKPPENTKQSESSNPETKANPQIPSPQPSETKNKPEEVTTPPPINSTESAKSTENTIPMFKRDGKSVVWDKDSSDYQNIYRWSGAKNLAEFEVFIYNKLDLDFKNPKVTFPNIIKAFKEYKNKNPKSQADCATGDTFKPNPRGLLNWFGNPYCEKTAQAPKANSFLSKIKRTISNIPLAGQFYSPELKSEPVPQSINLVKAAFKQSLEPQNFKNAESIIYSQLVNDLKLEKVDSTLRLSTEAKMPIIIPMIRRTLELGRARDETGLAETLKEIARVYREIRTPVREEVARLYNEQVVINYQKASENKQNKQKYILPFGILTMAFGIVGLFSWFKTKNKKS